MNVKTKSLIALTVLAILDAVIPFPILGVILINIVLQKPPWFNNVVRKIYSE